MVEALKPRQAPRLGKQRRAAAFVDKRQCRENQSPPFLARPQRVESFDPVYSARFVDVECRWFNHVSIPVSNHKIHFYL